MEKPHKKLEAWKQSMDLVVEIYKATEQLPKQEIYGLTNQVRRAAVSIPCNIAEGAARQTKKEFTNFLHIAQGSLSELDIKSKSRADLDISTSSVERVSMKEWNRSTK